MSNTLSRNSKEIPTRKRNRWPKQLMLVVNALTFGVQIAQCTNRHEGSRPVNVCCLCSWVGRHNVGTPLHVAHGLYLPVETLSSCVKMVGSLR